jgi:hypothetical protein
MLSMDILFQGVMGPGSIREKVFIRSVYSIGKPERARDDPDNAVDLDQWMGYSQGQKVGERNGMCRSGVGSAQYTKNLLKNDPAFGETMD